MTEQRIDLYHFGSGGHAEVAIDILSGMETKTNIGVVCQNISKLEEASRKWPNLQFLTQSQFDREEDLDTRSLFHIAMGSNAERRRLSELALKKGLAPSNIIAPTAAVSGLAKLGDGILIGPNAHVGPGATVGDYSIINSLANLEHNSTMGKYSHLAPGACVCGNSTVGEGSLIGANSVMKEFSSIGNWSTLGALSFLNFSHSAEYSILIGTPASVRGKESG